MAFPPFPGKHGSKDGSIKGGEVSGSQTGSVRGRRSMSLREALEAARFSRAVVEDGRLSNSERGGAVEDGLFFSRAGNMFAVVKDGQRSQVVGAAAFVKDGKRSSNKGENDIEELFLRLETKIVVLEKEREKLRRLLNLQLRYNSVNTEVKELRGALKTDDKKGKKTKKKTCYSCGERGHLQARCLRQKKVKRCWLCSETGHLAKACTVSKKKEADDVSQGTASVHGKADQADGDDTTQVGEVLAVEGTSEEQHRSSPLPTRPAVGRGRTPPVATTSRSATELAGRSRPPVRTPGRPGGGGAAGGGGQAGCGGPAGGCAAAPPSSGGHNRVTSARVLVAGRAQYACADSEQEYDDSSDDACTSNSEEGKPHYKW